MSNIVAERQNAFSIVHAKQDEKKEESFKEQYKLPKKSKAVFFAGHSFANKHTWNSFLKKVFFSHKKRFFLYLIQIFWF